MLLSEWLPTLDWSLLLYSLDSETDQPCFYYKSYVKRIAKFNAEYFQPPMGQLHAHVINMTNTIYSHGFISQVKYSRPTFMGFKTARLRLAVLNAHKGLPLIFYLLLKNPLLFLSCLLVSMRLIYIPILSYIVVKSTSPLCCMFIQVTISALKGTMSRRFHSFF